MENLPVAKLPPFGVVRQTEAGGIEMGVLDNGIPYLTERGLAKMCGLNRTTISSLAQEYLSAAEKPRIKTIKKKLEKAGYAEASLYLPAMNGGVEVRAYVAPVCIIILEYYAFDAENKVEQALNSFRSLAGYSLQEFIYRAVGYNPQYAISLAWQQYADRVSLLTDSVPLGYFSIFKEIHGLIADLISCGIPAGPAIVPDISVGLAWANHWFHVFDGENKIGESKFYEHNYPKSFPQSESNPKYARLYPDAALPEFRRWFREEYIPIKYPQYIIRIAKKITANSAKLAIERVAGKKVEIGPKKRLKITE